AVSHPDPAALAQVQLELVCEEQSQSGKSTKKDVLYRAAVPLGAAGAAGGVRAGRLDIPASEPGTLLLANHAVGWHLAASIGRTIRWKVIFPIRVDAAAAQPSAAPAGPARLESETVSIWLDSDCAAAAPGETLSGGYVVRPGPSGPLRSVELSVLWHTPPP